ncbi:phosphatase PAP2 family protein [Agromyces sp. CCNWLW203]|uniref:phosphatase PAP2 family protein n=1 Tax=Agromyces sp. CCNWLW203 TaxID=3112842 RepID=UPI002F960FA7
MKHSPWLTAPVLVVGGLAALVMFLPFPGSLSVVLFEAIAPTTSRWPGIDVPALAGLFPLAALLAIALLRAWRTDVARFAAGGAAALGTALAYLASEGLKLVVAQDRPCRDVVAVAECPPADDWSFPSNHSTVAFALFAAIVVVTHRSWVPWAAALLAGVVASARVAEGVHYPHDVAAGALLGMAVAFAASAALRRPALRASTRVAGRRTNRAHDGESLRR